MAHAVSRHNSKVLIDEQPLQVQPPRCKCLDCPVQGKCQTNCIVYGATIKETASGQTETYTGMTCRKFKERWREHEGNQRNESQRRSTKLSVHAWNLKDKNLDYEIDWKIIDRAPAFNPITRKCRLCLKEKYYIMYDRTGSTLNKRSEVFNTCRHRKQKLLENT